MINFWDQISIRFSLLWCTSLWSALKNHIMCYLILWSKLPVTFQLHLILLCVCDFYNFYFLLPWERHEESSCHSTVLMFYSFDVSFSSSSQIVHGKSVILIPLFKATCLFHCKDYETQGLISKGSAKQRTLHWKGFKLTLIFRCSHEHRGKHVPLATPSPTLQSQKHSQWNLMGRHLHQHKNNTFGTVAVSLSMFIDWLWLTKISE